MVVRENFGQKIQGLLYSAGNFTMISVPEFAGVIPEASMTLARPQSIYS
jgi:hypothetical protein